MSHLNVYVEDQDENPRNVEITIFLSDSRGIRVTGHSDGQTIFHRIDRRTAHDGTLVVDLIPNEEISPSGTRYLIRVDRSFYEFVTKQDEEEYISFVVS